MCVFVCVCVWVPLPRRYHVAKVLSHLQQHAIWRGEAYSTWVIPERASPNGITRAWCYDLGKLRDMHQSAVKSKQALCVCDRTVTS